MNKQQGNVLFIILIAVALFAALSYAVTSSTRSGGGGISEEEAELTAARILQYGSGIKQQMERMQIIGEYSQIYFDASAVNNVGLVYNGTSTPDTGKVIGLFNSNYGGMNHIPPDKTMYTPNSADGSRFYGMQIRGTAFSAGSIRGTSAPEIILTIEPLTIEVCRKINQKINGVNSAPLIAYESASFIWTYWNYNLSSQTSIFIPASPGGTWPILSNDDVCGDIGGGTYRYWKILKTQ